MCAAVVDHGQEDHHKLSLACRQECGSSYMYAFLLEEFLISAVQATPLALLGEVGGTLIRAMSCQVAVCV